MPDEARPLRSAAMTAVSCPIPPAPNPNRVGLSPSPRSGAGRPRYGCDNIEPDRVLQRAFGSCMASSGMVSSKFSWMRLGLTDVVQESRAAVPPPGGEKHDLGGVLPEVARWRRSPDHQQSGLIHAPAPRGDAIPAVGNIFASPSPGDRIIDPTTPACSRGFASLQFLQIDVRQADGRGPRHQLSRPPGLHQCHPGS